MPRVIAILLLVMAHCPVVLASAWYASPDASAGGDGSLQNPWLLQVALTKSTVIKPGDTLYLLGGRYQGPNFVSTISGASNNYVTVRSFSNQWAVITDGAYWVLGSNLPASIPNTRFDGVIFQGSDNYPEVGIGLKLGAERLSVFDKQTPANTWGLSRGQNALAHTAGEKAYLTADYIIHNGSYVIFRDFEITSTIFTNRVVGTNGNYLGSGLNLMSSGHGNKAVNLIIHNVGHPAIGFWQQGDGGEINGCLMWGNGIYDNDGTWTRGSGVYAQNESGQAHAKNNIVFRNFTTGMKVFGETGPVRDFHFDQNIAFDCPQSELEISSGSTATSNTWMVANYILGSPKLAYVSISNTHQYFLNNTVVNGGFGTSEHSESFYTNNLVFMPKGVGVGGATVSYLSTLLPRFNGSIIWDYNSYYLGDGSSPYSWVFTASDVVSTNFMGGGNLKFSNDSGKAWQDWTGFDAHSTYRVGWPSDFLKVEAMRLDYDANRHHIVVVNTSSTNFAALALAPLGYRVGDRYELRDAQNFFKVAQAGTYGGGTITLPLNLMEVAPITGTITHFTNEHTNVKYPGLFNAFVLTKPAGQSRPPPPTNLRIIQIRPGA